MENEIALLRAHLKQSLTDFLLLVPDCQYELNRLLDEVDEELLKGGPREALHSGLLNKH